ncbi:SigB/SigF/SigG family RNA polymerase sigma factor [Uniformispora flossi]|uniref:SigB/SigF/SigG family RNA polymerase sigma factor n=1 Tax=Uniformispora flossi TaxID=3390723 RepID=UPI003C2C38F7
MSVRTQANVSPAPRFTRQELRKITKAEARRISDRLLRVLRALEPEDPDYGDVRGTIVELNMPLVRYAARKFGHRRANREDVLQTGVVGLLKAIDAFDTERGVEFATFALPTISGEIKRYFRDTAWPVHVARSLQERFLAVAQTTDRLEQQLGHTPTEAEVAAEAGLSLAEVLEARDAGHAYLVDSLDAAAPTDDTSHTRSRPVDRLGYEETDFDLVEFRESVRPLLHDLPYREQQLLEMRFWRDLPQHEIGDRLGISQMHVSRLLTATLLRLREILESDRPPEASEPRGPRGAHPEPRPRAAAAARTG